MTILLHNFSNLRFLMESPQVAPSLEFDEQVGGHQIVHKNDVLLEQLDGGGGEVVDLLPYGSDGERETVVDFSEELLVVLLRKMPELISVFQDVFVRD